MTRQWALIRGSILVLAIGCGASMGLAQLRLPGGLNLPSPGQMGRTWPTNGPLRGSSDRGCPKVVDWLGQLQSQYPNVDLMNAMVDKVQQMAVPLFADDSFRKEFGVSYVGLSDTERRDFLRTRLIPCQTSRQYAQQKRLLTIFNAPFQPGAVLASPISPGRLIPALGQLQAARTVLQGDEQTLHSAPPSADTYEQATGLKVKRKDELGRVWPTERARFESTLNQAVARSAKPAVEAKITPLLTAPASPQVARQLRDAPRMFGSLFQAVELDELATLIGQLNDRRTAVLQELLQSQLARAASFPATRQGLDDGAEWFSTFQTVFLDSPALPEATALAKSYLFRRETVLTGMAPQFRQKIQTTEDPDTVATLYDDVFRLRDDRQTDTYRQLNAVRVARIDLLTKRAEQARLVAEENAEKLASLQGEIVASSLKVANLKNAKIYRALYVGDFAHSGIGRADVFFVDMFGGYLQIFGQNCPGSLPADKVMMTEPWCAVTTHLENRWGAQVGPDTCARWERRPIGVYADSRAFGAKVSLEGAAQRNGIRSFFQALAAPESLGGAMGMADNMAQDAVSLSQDLPRLVGENGCNSKALARLQENMARFAGGEDPLHVAGFQPDMAKTPRADNLDVRALADDLIRANAAGWIMNRYIKLDEARLDRGLDPQGRPRRIHATYDQKGFTTTGSVEIAFTDGVPACLYFADDPGNCKTPGPSVVRRYEGGQYRSQTTR